MTGTTQNGLVSGDVSLTRIVFEPGADLANILANAAAPNATPVNEQDFLTGLGLDVHIQSSATLQVLTSLSQNVQADIDLHLRGTRDHPALLGHISANQGEVNVFGTRYTISRGNITFINAVRIEPVLDLDLQTETRGITVDVVVTGTLSKLSMSYRSDPPLQAKEIIALLTVGQTPTFASETSNTRVQADTTALQAGATTVLGQAISPASGRLSKLFGITNVRIDPFVQNLSNSRQARLTLEQQISRDITVTYVTNLAQTSEQIFRFEWSFNPQYSIVAVRDDNGEFGVDIQYKKRFK
jgi:translocation and assembly module TamB